MKKKITLSTALTLILLTAALAVSVTMMLAMRYFNRQVQWVSQRKAMYTYIDEVDQALREHYATLNEETLRQNVIAGFVKGSGDAYAEYFSPNAYISEQERLSGYANNVGISLIRDTDNRLVIYAVAADSAAAKAGVQVGDVLTAVDGTEVGERKASDLQQSIDSAQKVLLSVRRGETALAFELSPYRYVVRSVQHKLLGSVGYIRITAFYENTPKQLEQSIAELTQAGVNGLILDLRDNEGGLRSSMQESISLLMPLGVYGSATDKKGNVTNLSSNVNQQLGAATVVLVNAATAGEAEFIAGAMQEASLATVIGETTAGKAKYQEYIKIELDNSAMKLTVGEYSLLKGGSFEGKGIVPTKEVSLTAEQQAVAPLLDDKTDPQIKAALSQINASDSGALNTSTTTLPTGSSTTAADGSMTAASDGTTTTTGAN
ncbi:MAG: PDZ domain-containing protein [Clostridia bacterium]|nr:PDZ domain-containing protein [Clostridia bacterium]